MIGQRDVYFPVASKVLHTNVYLAEKLTPGARFAGPAVVQATTTTLVVNPGDEVEVLADGGYALTIGVDTHGSKSRRPANVVTAAG